MEENISLKSLNTFGIDVKANQFAEVKSIEEIQSINEQYRLTEQPHLFLGGGSNVLFTKDFEGLVVRNNILGISIESEDENHVELKVGGGENWHNFVMHTIEQGYGGIENLSLIPGCVGASPMQNIGAYGIEVKQVITKVEALNLESNQLEEFDNATCQFGYRTSIFKTTHKGKYFITHVYFRLTKKHTLNLSYGAIESELKNMQVDAPNIRDVSNAVINIRKSKLPDPEEIGNAGSFFKNPVVEVAVRNEILAQHPDLPSYEQPNGDYKIAAGWLIEKAGWKGHRTNDYGVHEKQALVLVNYGAATGSEIYNLSTQIIESIQEQFGIVLEREVNVY